MVLIILAELSLSFHTKTVLTALKDRKYCTGLIVGTAIFSTSVKRNDGYMIGRLNILRFSHKVVTLPPWLTMSSLPVTTSNGTILIFSLPESQYSAKLKKLF